MNPSTTQASKLTSLDATSRLEFSFHTDQPLSGSVLQHARDALLCFGSFVSAENESTNLLFAAKVSADMVVTVRGHKINSRDEPTGRIDINVYRRVADESSDTLAERARQLGIVLPPNQTVTVDGQRYARIALQTSDPKIVSVNAVLAGEGLDLAVKGLKLINNEAMPSPFTWALTPGRPMPKNQDQSWLFAVSKDGAPALDEPATWEDPPLGSVC